MSGLLGGSRWALTAEALCPRLSPEGLGTPALTAESWPLIPTAELPARARSICQGRPPALRTGCNLYFLPTKGAHSTSELVVKAETQQPQSSPGRPVFQGAGRPRLEAPCVPPVSSLMLCVRYSWLLGFLPRSREL